MIGKNRPITTHNASRITPTTDATTMDAFFLYTAKPKPIARKMNRMDAVATEPFAALPAKELATISPNAAITSNNTSHANTVNNTRVL